MFFLCDASQAAMSLEETGAYITLMCFEWTRAGLGIPDDLRRCARLARCPPRQMRRMWPTLRAQFIENDSNPGYLVHPLLQRERERQANPTRVRNAQLIQLLVDRDGDRCAYCGARDVFLEIEHRHPRSRGGSDDPSNLTLACGPCNRAKGTKTAEEFTAARPLLIQ
jgi:5-methylcytosine-specific restriction endonuclease McrA